MGTISLPSYFMDVKRLAVPDLQANFDIPNEVSWAVIKNVGAVDIRFNFDGNFSNHYWTIKPDTETPVMKVSSGRKFHTDGVGGSTTIEVLMWG